MQRIIAIFACLWALTINGTAAGAAASRLTATGIPPGFDDLATTRVILVDVYFGERKVAETLAIVGPGSLKFRSPADVLAGMPDLIAAPALSSALAGELPTNAREVCVQSNAGDCGVLKPELVGIIYDEGRFRVDLFINPKFVRTSHTAPSGYLQAPSRSLSMTNSLAFDASGTVGGRSGYNLQDRTIVGYANARIRANTSIASHLGLVVDDLVGELDVKGLRYSAGLFWAPGNEFIGQRRIIGAGVGTQFDTCLSQEALHSTPLIVFLAEPARVELLVDGRLVSSRSYVAGNIDVDSSALPEGSYSVLIRIRHSNGSVEEQSRFFVKNSQVPPAGHSIFYAYGGMLANTRAYHPISPSSTFYYQMGAAERLSNHVAVDLAAVGTQHKAIVTAGGWLVEGPLRLRAAGLASSAADWGALFQMSVGGRGPFNMSIDVRRIWSHDGTPLVPLPSYVTTFDIPPATGVQLATGSYTQATASLGARVGRGFVSLIGSYREERAVPADYTVGPALSLPLVTHNAVQLAFEASAQRSRTASAAFVGLRMFLASRHVSTMTTVGQGYQRDTSGNPAASSRTVGSLSAQYSKETSSGTLVSLEAGADRDMTSTTVRGAGIFDSRLGDLRADVLRDVEGHGGTQYDVSFQSAFAVTGKAAVLGSRNVDQSALIIALAGDAEAAFTVLVDDAARGQVAVGQHLSLFMPAYHRYRVRLVPVSPINMSYDSGERVVTLYPGNVRLLSWRAESFFTVFGQATSVGGAPIANALVQTAKSVAETDENGYFQIDTRRNDQISIKTAQSGCRLELGKFLVKDNFASVGKVVCR